ncbi:MAG: hypothetical protein MRZ90_04760 [Candidatus Gastranaerophilales bacterium]|nr:hypothetical protein [Candidatus Gastranaerophilales bacterium]
MKTNGIPSQMKDAWNQAQTTFGAAQKVREAVDNGGLAGGVSEGINQFCKDSNNIVAKAFAGLNGSALGKFFIKNLFHLSFNDHGDSVEINTDDIAKEMGQDGKLGGFLLKMIDGKSQWLSKTCSTVCKGCSKLTSSFVGKLIDKIPDVTVRDGIKDLLSQDEKSSKARSRQETKQAREEAYNEIDKQVKGIESFSDLKDQISDLEVSLTDDQKDKLYMKWAQSHTTIGEGDKEEVFDELSRKAKRNCGYEFDVEDSQKKQNRSNAVKKLFTKESSKK